MPSQTVSTQSSDVRASRQHSLLLPYIKRYPVFESLPQATQEQLAVLLDLERHSKQATIFHYKDPGNAMYFLCVGTVRFVAHDYTGKALVLEEIQPGDLFGEVALFSGGVRTADAVSTSDTVLLVLRQEKLVEFLRSCPEVSEYLLERMASRLTSSNRLLRNASTRVEEVVAAERTLFDRMVKRLVDVFGTFPSFVVHVLIILLWIGIKCILHSPWMSFEKSDLSILGLIINVEGFAISMLILVNQARESKEESVRDRTEYEATMHTDNSVRFLHEKVDALAAEVRRFRNDRHSP